MMWVANVRWECSLGNYSFCHTCNLLLTNMGRTRKWISVILTQAHDMECPICLHCNCHSLTKAGQNQCMMRHALQEKSTMVQSKSIGVTINKPNHHCTVMTRNHSLIQKILQTLHICLSNSAAFGGKKHQNSMAHRDSHL